MKTFLTYKKMLAALILMPMLGVGNSEAGSSFNSQATISFAIDSISNTSTTSDLSGLAILGSFEQAGSPTSYLSTTGNGSDGANNPSVSPVSVTIGNPFVHTFSANGNVSSGTVEAGNIGWYSLALNNTSATDDYKVNLTLTYNLLANASGEFADSDVILDVFTNDNPLLGNIFVNADALNSPNAGANGSFPQYTFDVPHGSSLVFSSDVTINGNLQASPVPMPAAVWSFLAGLLGILGLKKRKTSSGETA
jgi:hypothetical protein